MFNLAFPFSNRLENKNRYTQNVKYSRFDYSWFPNSEAKVSWFPSAFRGKGDNEKKSTSAGVTMIIVPASVAMVIFFAAIVTELGVTETNGGL